ncbi:Xenotropic and polytropic retrovirus receptor 1 [Fasciola hepatica]|uniref:Xenotropic and polytropic retrovirus receptor 1 n=1 Tax=Fasciola hepatica TaxID=6192 RepID=A0A4E0QZC6_FASHE|nr:Xenotropic and polytropic retrovirus receptor 1 [Fasciola hepatica]
MKFAEKLTAHLTPEWRKQYIDYDELKEFLYKSIQDIDRSEDWTEEVITHLDECDIEFFERCNNALQKIDVFFSEKLAEATRKHANLSEELDDFLQFESTKTTFFAGSKLSVSWRNRESARRSSSEQSDSKSKENGAIRVKLSAVDSDEKQEIEGIVRHRRSRVSTTAENKKPLKPSIKEKKTFRKMHDLKLAFSEFYLSLVLLQNYQTLNFTGFRKILKKHDKLFRRDNGLIWRQQHVEPAKFNTSREVDDLISKVENEYTEKLEQGDRQRAMKRLRVPPLSERASFFLATIWGCAVIYFLFSAVLNIPSYASPFVLVLFMLLCLLNPFKFGYYRARRWLLRVLHNPRAVFQFGFFAGIFLVQSIVIILACLFLRPLPKHYLPALRIFRTTFLIIFFLCLFGLNTYGWRSSGVNNVLIFEINPRSHMDHFQLLEVS